VPAAAALPAATKTPAAPRVLQPLEFAPDPEEPVRRPPAAPVSRVPERRTPQPVAPRTAPANREEEAHYAARPPSARRLLGTQGHRRGGWLRRMLRWAFGRS
jgi:hypothetical protein